MKDPHLKTFAGLIISLVLAFGACNFINQMHHAQTKAFWLDETSGLTGAVAKNSYGELLAKGAERSEANPAPLDYMALKVFEDLKARVHAFGMSDEVYYRLWPNFMMIFGGLVVVVLFAVDIVGSPIVHEIKIFQLILLLFLPLLYLYRPQTYHYAAESRPYALWFALWLMAVALCSRPRIHKWALGICLSLMAMTMVGSIFQIVAMAMAFGIVHLRQQGWRQTLMEGLQVFTLPLALVMFYGSHGQYGHGQLEPPDVSWHRFFTMWGHEVLMVSLLLACCLSLWFASRTGVMSVGPLAAIIVFLMGPAIVQLTLSKGYFFTERQYIYYDAHRSVFWLSLINILPFYVEKIKDRKKQILAMAVFFLLWTPFIFPKKTIIYIKTVIHQCFY